MIGRSWSVRFAHLRTGAARSTEVVANQDTKVTGWRRFYLFSHTLELISMLTWVNSNGKGAHTILAGAP
eukprot:1195914-Prorocentrum_minimum.AAC.3